MAELKQLSVVLELAEKKEQQAMQQLVAAQQQQQTREQQLTGLMKYRNEYIGQMTQQSNGGVNITSLRQLQSFIGRLDEAVQQQQQTVAQAKHVVLNCRNAWQETRRHQQSIEFLIKQQQQHLAAIELKREQKMQDEFSTIQFARQKRDR